MKTMKQLFALLLLGALMLTPGCSFLHPEQLKPVPVAAGQDAIVVNAERIQETSLFAYEQLINWEFENRAILPAGVSRTVDQVRAEFKPNWQASRQALADYQANKPDAAATLGNINAALSAAQTAMLTFRKDQSQVSSLFTALARLSDSVKALKN